MSSFFERNKKKSLLAALLMLLRRGKGVIALLAFVAILSGVFVLPGGMKIPWATRGAEKLGVATGGNRFSGMSSALRSARESTAMTDTMGAEKRRLRETQAKNGDSSAGAFLDLNALPKFAKFSKATGGSASSISGIVHPDEVNRRDRSLKMEKGEFLGGLVKSAEAGVIAGGGPMAENAGMADGGKLADPGKMAELTRGSAVNQGESVVDQAMNFQKVPDVPGGNVKLPKGEKYEQLNAATAGDLAMKHCGESGKDCPTDGGGDTPPPAPEMGKPTFYKLAEARAYSVSAAPPTCLEPGCPKEYAHTTAAIVFDGQDPKVGRIMASAELNENTSPQVPDKSQIDSIKRESMDYYDQTQQCQAYEAWANGNKPAQPELAAKYDAIASAEGGLVGTVAKNAGVATGGADPDPVVESGTANERQLMREMQYLSCAMSCSADGSRQPAENIACEGWKTSQAVSGLPAAANCSYQSCDQGSCDKNKAQLCKSIGNRMRAVCNALEAIWTVKHKCPLAGGTLDLHDCKQ